MAEIKWKEEPAQHDYPAAFSYLSLIFSENVATGLVDLLRNADMSEFHSKDIFRASWLPMLDQSDHHVHKDMIKMDRGDRLSPLLLVRAHGKIIIADGYHRLCAVYKIDGDARIPCKIVTG